MKKLQNPDTTGSYISLDRNACRYHAEGRMNLGVDYGHMTIKPAGELDHDLAENKVSLDMTLPVKFHFSTAALDSMMNDINGRSGLETANTESEFYEANLEEIVGQPITSKYMDVIHAPDSLPKNKKGSIPDRLKHTLIFSDLHFNWNTTTNSYVAQDDINISMINGKTVNKQVEGFVEIVKQKHNDKLYVYLKPDNDRYYMFYFSQGMMRTYSNNRKFVEAIKEVPNRKREIGGGLFSNANYRYLLATQTIRSRVMSHINDVREILSNTRQEQMAQEQEEESPEAQAGNEQSEAAEESSASEQSSASNPPEEQSEQQAEEGAESEGED